MKVSDVSILLTCTTLISPTDVGSIKLTLADFSLGVTAEDWGVDEMNLELLSLHLLPPSSVGDSKEEEGCEVISLSYARLKKDIEDNSGVGFVGKVNVRINEDVGKLVKFIDEGRYKGGRCKGERGGKEVR